MEKQKKKRKIGTCLLCGGCTVFSIFFLTRPFSSVFNTKSIYSALFSFVFFFTVGFLPVAIGSFCLCFLFFFLTCRSTRGRHLHVICIMATD